MHAGSEHEACRQVGQVFERQHVVAFDQELDAAENPRPFDPKARYKANEIILHPEWGRGKVENVIKGSMLVRFRDRLRPLDMK